MIDSHAHLEDARFDADRDAVVRRARDAGVERIVCPGTNLAGSRKALELARRHEGVFAAVGMDRDAAPEVDARALAELERLAGDERCVAVGEIGLDYHYDTTPRDVQQRAFDAQLDLARRTGRPVIVHCREAFDDCLAMLDRAEVRGVMHCFSGDAKTAARCCDLGLMVSFAGPLTFRRADALREAARAVPADRLLIETDSPYLSPEPVRGRRNEPAHLAHTARRLAAVLGWPFEEVARITADNALALFGLDPRRAARVFVGIGSNLGDRAAHVAAALDALSRLPRTELVRVSSLIETEPVGVTDQGRFLNGAVELSTELGPLVLLRELQAIERALGRTRTRRWGPRTMDLDILLYGDTVIRRPDIEVPHPRMCERDFVLRPLAEIAPDVRHPVTGRTVRELLAELGAGA